MADKSIGELIAAQSVTPTDLFVLEQNGTAKKLTGQTLENWLVSFADGHGGIQSIEKLSTNILADTYRITLSDTTTFDFVVNNGRGITGISKTSTSGLVDTYTISYNDGTTSQFTITNGAKGDKGDNAYIWIKYASQEPTESSHSMGDIPDDWIGIYSGNASTAPTNWQQYQWFEIKGEKGDTGNPATILSRSVTYQVGDSGTVVPSGPWLDDVPSVPQGKYLWTRTVVQFNTGDPITWYSVSYSGINGTGAVSTVAGVSPDETGNVSLTAENVGARPNTWTPTAAEVGAIPNTSGSVTRAKLADNAVSVVKSIQLPTTGWTKNSDGVYEANVTVSGLKTTDTVILGLRRGTVNPDGWTMTLAAFDSDQETFSKILAGRITAANTLHLYAREAITKAIYLNCWVVSK